MSNRRVCSPEPSASTRAMNPSPSAAVMFAVADIHSRPRCSISAVGVSDCPGLGTTISPPAPNAGSSVPSSRNARMTGTAAQPVSLASTHDRMSTASPPDERNTTSAASSFQPLSAREMTRTPLVPNDCTGDPSGCRNEMNVSLNAPVFV